MKKLQDDFSCTCIYDTKNVACIKCTQLVQESENIEIQRMAVNYASGAKSFHPALSMLERCKTDYVLTTIQNR